MTLNRRLVFSLTILAVALTSRVAARQTPSAAAAPCTPAIAERLDAQFTPWLDDRTANAGFSGVVVAACNGRIVYSAARGVANRTTGEKNTVDTRFNLGSMNKMWTAIAIAQLVEQGRIDVNAPVGKYLPDLKNVALRDTVLVRHLLTHTSGLGTYFQNGFLRDRVFATAGADYLPFFADDVPAFTPGSKMQYSNAGFALLGAIVERVSGVNYFDYMNNNVLVRAGMAHAEYADVRKHPAGVAVPYGALPGATEANDMTDQLEPRGGPAGGALAAASDLVAFGAALRSGKLVGPALVREFTTGKVDMGGGKYAYGFGEGSLAGWHHVGHNGGAPGVGAEFLSFPEHGVDLVVLTNMDMPMATQVIGRAARILAGQDLPFTPPSGAPFVPAAIGADGWPASELGARVAGFFAALVNGGDVYAKFIETEMTPSAERTPKERAEGGKAVVERFGALKLMRVVSQTVDSIQVLMSSEKQGSVKFLFDFEPKAPHRIMQIDMKPGTGDDQH